MKRMLAVAIAVALPAAQAQAACLHHGDMRALLSLALPDAIDGLTTQCAGALPRSAFLPNQGAALARRYRGEVPADPARARHAIEVASGQDLSFLASDDTVTTMAHQFIEKTIHERIPAGDCAMVDGLVALAAPLQPDAMIEALMLVMEVAGPDAIKGGVSLCRPQDQVSAR